MNEWLSQLGQRVPQIALGFLAAKHGGPQAVAGFQQGLYESQQRQEALARQAQLDEERRAQQAAQEARLANADTRADEQAARAEESARVNRVQSALQYLDRYAQQQGETAVDAPGAENALLGRASSLESMFGVPQGQLAGMVPNMAGPVGRGVRKDVSDLLANAERRLTKTDPEADINDATVSFTWENATPRVQKWLVSQGHPEGQPFKPSQLQAVSAQPTITVPKARKTDVPNTPEEQDITDAIAVAETTKGAPLTPEERIKVRRESMTAVSGARRKPEDTELGDIRRETAELRRDMLKNAQQSGQFSPKQIATFNQIAGAYERSPLIRAGDRTIVLTDAIKAIEKNPSDPASQLSLAYSYIQALDTYQSAVREGELGNLGILGTRWQGFVIALNRVASEGAFLPPEVAKNIAANAKQLAATIETGRQRKQQEFGSRARVSGVGDMWDQFVGGFAKAETPDPAKSARDKLNQR